jgi:hypothetical protein
MISWNGRRGLKKKALNEFRKKKKEAIGEF